MAAVLPTIAAAQAPLNETPPGPVGGVPAQLPRPGLPELTETQVALPRPVRAAQATLGLGRQRLALVVGREESSEPTLLDGLAPRTLDEIAREGARQASRLMSRLEAAPAGERPVSEVPRSTGTVDETVRAPADKPRKPPETPRSNPLGCAEGDTITCQVADTWKGEVVRECTTAIDEVLSDGAPRANGQQLLMDAQDRVAGEFEVPPVESSGQWRRTACYAPRLGHPVAIEIGNADRRGKLLERERIALRHAQTTRGQP
ncbi:MAG: hypothetical protein C0505_08125 [Leptothrix sp. (in: Bacteria)]|nr:hypothetical protein [Leptothrix sp. (in: b-proteobacteria)]